MRPAGEAFAVGVEQDHGQREGGKNERQPIELGRRENKYRTANQHECNYEAGSERAGGKSARPGSRVGGVNRGIRQTIEGHGRRPGRDHGDNDPNQCVPAGKTIRRQHGSAQSERKHEDGVLPFDHLQSDAQVV